MLQAVILAGGLGTRLREVISDKPKSLAEINGRVFLEYQIEFLKKFSITDIIICIGYMGYKIEDHFSNGNKIGVSIRYSREQDQLGTGGAIKNASYFLEQRFFVLNGDTVFQTNLNNMRNFHEKNCADATIALTKVSDESRYGSVTCQDMNTIGNKHGNRIIGFSEKSSNSGLLISAGIYLMEKSLFSWNDLPNVFSLEKDYLPQVVVRSRVLGFVDTDAYFVDIGTVEGYRKFSEDLNFKRIPFD